jgi:hypothetical protein
MRAAQSVAETRLFLVDQKYQNANGSISLQVIIASGLYPNVAVPDPHNSQRRESEALFHTRHVAEARLHPASVLVGAEVPPTAREVLVYTTLLETHKLYVTNLVRGPCTPESTLRLFILSKVFVRQEVVSGYTPLIRCLWWWQIGRVSPILVFAFRCWDREPAARPPVCPMCQNWSTSRSWFSHPLQQHG